MLNLPARMEIRMTQIDDALVALDSSVDEVTTEMNDLAARVEAGELSDAQVAAEIRARAQKLSDVRPETPVVDAATPPVDETPVSDAGE